MKDFIYRNEKGQEFKKTFKSSPFLKEGYAIVNVIDYTVSEKERKAK